MKPKAFSLRPCVDGTTFFAFLSLVAIVCGLLYVLKFHVLGLGSGYRNPT